MRRSLSLFALFAMVLLGSGCRHIAGRCDCTHDSSVSNSTTPMHNYPTVGKAVAAPSATAPSEMPAQMPGK